ncbi:aminoacyl-tRNA deacylase [Sporosarcina sp. P37]|uniref:Cys-tRNA(Pro) deacylase n=1 Tax=unclassified Sporosarcina TaxID=2647733 RepID=UPI0009C09E18|nr:MULTISPECIES: Cys-tRNA(Pro) deacylase [unclassified Sporosarcina]ARD48723.1 aminoacyl-tRNA deacylase [Sporosarcina sp. P33]ARK25231.1 aminoacyl-tRNA deacylase [Sporosarcina sp. P37]PID17161.1 Cys-tRNA(Pro) deacylase [Sporosarcina sp. P35]
MAKKQKSVKTNAIRIIEKEGIAHEIRSYQTEDGQNDGVSVANKTNEPAENVYKTLVAMASKTDLLVFIIPVAEELDLKKAAKTAGFKKIDMLPMKELTKETGYVRGGCSPVGMKRELPTFIDSQAETLDYLYVSAGKVGLQMKLSPDDLASVTKAQFSDLVK